MFYIGILHVSYEVVSLLPVLSENIYMYTFLSNKQHCVGKYHQKMRIYQTGISILKHEIYIKILIRGCYNYINYSYYYVSFELSSFII